MLRGTVRCIHCDTQFLYLGLHPDRVKELRTAEATQEADASASAGSTAGAAVGGVPAHGDYSPTHAGPAAGSPPADVDPQEFTEAEQKDLFSQGQRRPPSH